MCFTFPSITSVPVLIEILLVNRHLEADRNPIQHMVTTIRISSLLVLQLPFRKLMPTVLLTELPPITTKRIFILNSSTKPMERSRLTVACINRRQTALLWILTAIISRIHPCLMLILVRLIIKWTTDTVLGVALAIHHLSMMKHYLLFLDTVLLVWTASYSLRNPPLLPTQLRLLDGCCNPYINALPLSLFWTLAHFICTFHCPL